MLGPSRGNIEGSSRIAFASSSGVRSRVEPNSSMCSIAADAMSGGGAVGEGKFFGSYRWYECTTPPA